MPNLICLIPNHGYVDDTAVWVSWLGGTYYIYDKDTDSFKLDGIGDGAGSALVQFTGSVTDGFVREDPLDPGNVVISGLDHLEGESVYVTSGGEIVGVFTVASGDITVPEALPTYQVGLPYTCKIKTTRLALPQQAGAIQGQVKRISRAVSRFSRTSGGKIGQEYEGVEFMSDMDINFQKDSQDIKLPVDGGFSSEGYSVIKSELPQPMTLISTVVDFTLDERR